MQTLKLTLRPGIGALQAALGLPEPLEERDLDFGGGFLRDDALFGQLDTSEFPLRDGHLLDVELLGPGFGVPFGFEAVAELVEVVGVLAGQHDGAGAQSVTEAVQLNGRMAMFGDGIYYVPASRQIWFYSIADKQPRHVFDLNRDLGSGFAISPDRKWLLFAPGEVRQGDLYLVDNINRSSGQGMPPASPRALLDAAEANGYDLLLTTDEHSVPAESKIVMQKR